MWRMLQVYTRTDARAADSVRELLGSASRRLIVVSGATSLVWQVLAVGTSPLENLPRFFAVVPLVLLTCIVALVFLPTRFLLAQAVWQLGAAAAITQTVYVYRQPETGFAFILQTVHVFIVPDEVTDRGRGRVETGIERGMVDTRQCRDTHRAAGSRVDIAVYLVVAGVHRAEQVVFGGNKLKQVVAGHEHIKSVVAELVGSSGGQHILGAIVQVDGHAGESGLTLILNTVGVVIHPDPIAER